MRVRSKLLTLAAAGAMLQTACGFGEAGTADDADGAQVRLKDHVTERAG